MRSAFLRVVMVFSFVLSSSAWSAKIPAQLEWNLKGEEEGIKSYSAELDTVAILPLKGEAIIDAPIAKVMGVLNQTERQTEWMMSIAEARNVKLINESERIVYTHSKAPWPFKDRDFLVYSKIDADPVSKTLSVTIKSIEDSAVPDTGENVRGDILLSRYVFRSIEKDTKTHASLELVLDPKGNIPTFLVNMFQSKWPLETLKGLRLQAEKKDVPSLERVNEVLGIKKAI